MAESTVLTLNFGLLHKGHEFTADIVGEARRTPVFTRGILQLLDDHLSTLPTRK